jgi:Ca-activated chloride channel family protein
MTPDLKPTLVITPLRQAVSAAGGTLEVLVRVQAPPRPEGVAAPARQPLRLAIVVDRSGSMSGQPLQEALRCVEYIAAGLSPSDRMAVVLYDDGVQVPITLGSACTPEAVRAALAGVESGGSTALFDGWEAGAKCLEGGSRGATSRVLLLSDGQANAGLCDPVQIEQHCARWAARGVTTTTVGLGRDFNEDLMIVIARAGGGQHYYGQTAEDLHDSFDEELSLLQSLFLRGLQAKLVAGQGVVVETLGVVHPATGGGYAMPDLAWGSEAWMLLRLHVAAASPQADPAKPQALLAVTLRGESMEGAAVVLCGVLALPFVPESDLAGLPVDPTVQRRLAEIEFAEATGRVHELLSQGKSSAAKAQLTRLEAQVASHPWLADKLAALKLLVERDASLSLKEMRYSMSRASRRLAPVQEPAYVACETSSDAVPAFLRRKAVEGQGRKPRP